MNHVHPDVLIPVYSWSHRRSDGADGCGISQHMYYIVNALEHSCFRWDASRQCAIEDVGAAWMSIIFNNNTFRGCMCCLVRQFRMERNIQGPKDMENMCVWKSVICHNILMASLPIIRDGISVSTSCLFTGNTQKYNRTNSGVFSFMMVPLEVALGH